MKNSIENTKIALNYLQIYVAIAIITAVITAIASLSMGQKSIFTTIITLQNVVIVTISMLGVVALRELKFFKQPKNKITDIPISVLYTMALLFSAVFSFWFILCDQIPEFDKFFPYMIGGIGILILVFTLIHARYAITIALFIPATTSCYKLEPEVYFRCLAMCLAVIAVVLIIKYVFFRKWSRMVSEPS